MVAKQYELSEKWDKHWEFLQQCEYTHMHRPKLMNTYINTYYIQDKIDHFLVCLWTFAPVSPLFCSVLEVHQFAQEAVVAEAWLTAQEPFISSKELGGSVDEVEQLIRRHEAFRKAAATWEERFSSLRRLTTVISSSSLLCKYSHSLARIGESFNAEKAKS